MALCHMTLVDRQTIAKDTTAFWLESDGASLHENERIDQRMLKRYLVWPKGPIYYLAGPPGMVATMRELLNSLGVGDNDLKTEHVGRYAQHQNPSASRPETIGHSSPCVV